jgi:hypothetical protein
VPRRAGHVLVEPLVQLTEKSVFLVGEFTPLAKQARLSENTGELLVVLAVRANDEADKHTPIMPLRTVTSLS